MYKGGTKLGFAGFGHKILAVFESIPIMARFILPDCLADWERGGYRGALKYCNTLWLILQEVFIK